MSEHMPGRWRPISFTPETFAMPMLKTTLAFAGSIVLVMLVGKLLPQTRLFHTLTLAEVSPVPEQEDSLLGLEGIAHSDLRPSGTAYFDDRKLDVVTYGDYIARQTPVRIVEIHGNRIVVEDISHG
jgi:membrane-bound serine protease (ClpP class)